MKTCKTSDRLLYIMETQHLKQIDILKKCEPFCKKYNIKLNKNDLSQYVNGKVEPGQFKLFILAEALNVSEAWLMGFDVPINKHSNSLTSTGLTSGEKDLLSSYNKLNEKGKAEAVKRINELTQINDYIFSNQSTNKSAI